MEILYYDLLETSWGWVGVLASTKGIRRTTLPQKTPHDAMERLRLQVSHAVHRSGAFPELHGRLEVYCRGGVVEFDDPLDLEASPPFFRAAWVACRGIPPGETRSYAWLASQAGRPKGARAAGQAMARNPLPLIIPCHRVIASHGGLGGFGDAGLAMKHQLLELEAGRSPPGSAQHASPS